MLNITTNIKEAEGKTTRSILVTAPHYNEESKDLLVVLEQEQVSIHPSIINKYGEVENCFNIRFNLKEFEAFLAKIKTMLEESKNDRISIPTDLV